MTCFGENSSFRRRSSVAMAAIFAAALGIVAFLPSIHNEFLWDDTPFIVMNPAVTQPGPWYRFWRLPFWPRIWSSDKLYRPLTTWSYRANLLLSGQPSPEPFSFHVVNLALHGLTSAGVAWLAWRLTRRTGVAWVAGALFATHPLHTEAVSPGYGRSELLAGFFAVWLMARYMDAGEPDEDRRSADSAEDGHKLEAAPPHHEKMRTRSAWFHVFNTLLLLAGIMSKEHVVFVWPILMLYDLWRFRRTRTPDRPPLREWLDKVVAPAHAGFMLALSLFFYLRFWLFKWNFRLAADRVSYLQSPLAHGTLTEHLLTPFRLLWLTVKLCVWPRDLCPIWSIPALSLPRHLEADVIAGMVVALALVILAITRWRRSFIGVMVVGMGLLLAMPIQALPMAHWIYAERWLYMPSVLLAILVAIGFDRLGVVGRCLGVAAALVLLPASWAYTTRFHDFETMTTEVVNRQPDNYNGRWQLANWFLLKKEYQNAIQEAKEMNERFGGLGQEPPSGPYLVLLRGYLAEGDGQRALDALNKYEWLRRDITEPSLAVERQQAEELIARQRAQSQPTTSPNTP